MARFAVIDSAQRGGFYKRLDKHGASYRSLFDGYAESNLPEIAPLLVRLSDGPDLEHGRFWREIQQVAVDRPAVSVLESDCTLDQLAAHLRSFHIVKLPDKQAMILRWYDTRILPVWMEVLDPSQRAGFVRGITRWSYYDRFGDEHDLPLLEGSSLSPLTPYQLDDAQYAKLREACEVDALIAHLQTIIRDELSSIPLRTLHQFVDEHLYQAREHGLADVDDRAQFLLLALYTGGRYREHPHVAHRLAKSTDVVSHIPFQEWMDALPDDVWQTGSPLWVGAPAGQVETAWA